MESVGLVTCHPPFYITVLPMSHKFCRHERAQHHSRHHIWLNTTDQCCQHEGKKQQNQLEFLKGCSSIAYRCDFGIPSHRKLYLAHNVMKIVWYLHLFLGKPNSFPYISVTNNYQFLPQHRILKKIKPQNKKPELCSSSYERQLLVLNFVMLHLSWDTSVARTLPDWGEILHEHHQEGIIDVSSLKRCLIKNFNKQ